MERWPSAGLAPKVRRLRAAGFRHRLWRQVAAVGGVAAAASLVLPATVSSAAVSRPQPSLASLVAQAKSLGHQIDVLSEQYDGLRIQMAEARAEAKTAMTTYRQDATRLVSGQAAIGQLAAESYMNGGLATPLQVLTSTDTSTMLSRAAIMQQLQTRERGPGQRAVHRGGGRPAGARHRGAADDQGDHPGQVHGGQEAGSSRAR